MFLTTETFPGLFFKDNEGIHYTLFSNGKIVIKGVKDLKLAEVNLKKFKRLISILHN